MPDDIGRVEVTAGDKVLSRIEVHFLWDDAEIGVWCASCALPSAYRVPIIGIDERTLGTHFRFHVVACVECGRYPKP